MSTPVKTKLVQAEPYSSQKTFKFRERMKRGAAIADALPKFMGAQEAAAKLGISDTMLRRTECIALAKIEEKIREMCAAEGGEI